MKWTNREILVLSEFDIPIVDLMNTIRRYIFLFFQSFNSFTKCTQFNNFTVCWEIFFFWSSDKISSSINTKKHCLYTNTHSKAAVYSNIWKVLIRFNFNIKSLVSGVGTHKIMTAINAPQISTILLCCCCCYWFSFGRSLH